MAKRKGDVSRESATMLQVLTRATLTTYGLKIDTINEVLKLVFGFIIILTRFRDTTFGSRYGGQIQILALLQNRI